MRKGKNTSKNKPLELTPCNHRVIIPLYIPNEESYYENSFKIFKMCLFSIKKTAISPLKISVISNGSSNEVNSRLLDLHKNKHIDELIIEKEAVGKINSILKALRTSQERLITLTDGDVLFLDNWEEEVLNIFKNFPKAGMVSPVPVFRSQLRYTYNIWRSKFFSSKLKFRPVKNPEALTLFAKSLGWPSLKDKLKDVILTLKQNNHIAVVGNSHFVGTYKREVFNYMPKENSKYKLGGSSEYLYNDLPVILSGGYKLATYDNYAYHMGNSHELWMDDVFNNLTETRKQFDNFSEISSLKGTNFFKTLIEKVLKKLFSFSKFKKWIYKKKGLTKQQVTNFLDTNY